MYSTSFLCSLHSSCSNHYLFHHPSFKVYIFLVLQSSYSYLYSLYLLLLLLLLIFLPNIHYRSAHHENREQVLAWRLIKLYQRAMRCIMYTMYSRYVITLIENMIDTIFHIRPHLRTTRGPWPASPSTSPSSPSPSSSSLSPSSHSSRNTVHVPLIPHHLLIQVGIQCMYPSSLTIFSFK